MTAKALSLKEGNSALYCLNIDHIAGKMMVVRSIEVGMELFVVEPSANPLRDLKKILIFQQWFLCR